MSMYAAGNSSIVTCDVDAPHPTTARHGKVNEANEAKTTSVLDQMHRVPLPKRRPDESLGFAPKSRRISNPYVMSVNGSLNREGAAELAAQDGI